MKYSAAHIEKLIRDLFQGLIPEDDLPEDLYYAIADYLKEALYKGFGGTLADFEGKDLELLKELRENVYMFSAAKTYQQIDDMRDLLFDGDRLRSFSEFKEEAMAVYEQYNENWLAAEYDTAIGQAQNASKWNDIEKNKGVLPYLRYSATEDEGTCEICGPLDGMIASVDDPIWNEIYPENHFRCRCLVLQEDDSVEATPDNSDRVAGVTDKMNPVFLMNAGKDRVVFNENHPYFEVSKGDKGFARENFGLPIPEEDE